MRRAGVRSSHGVSTWAGHANNWIAKCVPKFRPRKNSVFQGSVNFRIMKHQGARNVRMARNLGEKKMRGKVARQLHWMSRIKPNLPHAAPLPRPKFMRVSEEHNNHIHIDISFEPKCVTSHSFRTHITLYCFQD